MSRPTRTKLPSGVRLVRRIRQFTRWFLVSGWLTLALPHVASVRAQDVDEPDQSGDRKRLIEAAVAAYDAQNYQRSRELFLEAHRLQPSARALRAVGMCSYNLRDPVDAVLQLQAALEETRMALTEPQRTSTLELLQRAGQKVAWLELSLAPTAAMVTVDGERPRTTTRGALLLLPGTHRVLGLSPGYITQERVVDVIAGEHAALRFDLQRAVVLEPTEPVAPSSAPHRSGRAATTARRFVLGTGAVGMVLFAVAGGLALHEQSGLRTACYEGSCAPDSYEQVDRYDRLKVAATVGLVTGSALLTADFVWWLYDRHQAAHSKASASVLRAAEPTP